MCAERRNRRAEVRAWLSERGVQRIAEVEFGELLCALAPVSEGYLRKLLRESGVTLAPLVEGVRQANFEELEGTLGAMGEEYAAALAAHDAPRARTVRRTVITAKDHARFAMRRASLSEQERIVKEEMVLWMLTWLENPGVFSTWLELRKKARQVTKVTAYGSAAE